MLGLFSWGCWEDPESSIALGGDAFPLYIIASILRADADELVPISEDMRVWGIGACAPAEDMLPMIFSAHIENLYMFSRSPESMVIWGCI